MLASDEMAVEIDGASMVIVLCTPRMETTYVFWCMPACIWRLNLAAKCGVLYGVQCAEAGGCAACVWRLCIADKDVDNANQGAGLVSPSYTPCPSCASTALSNHGKPVWPPFF